LGTELRLHAIRSACFSARPPQLCTGSALGAAGAVVYPFQWNANDFNPDFGGINRHVWLHVTGNDARIDFQVKGPAVWRGGYDSGRLESTNNLYLNTELGINRVALRATRLAGAVMLTATRDGLKSGVLSLATAPVAAGRF